MRNLFVILASLLLMPNLLSASQNNGIILPKPLSVKMTGGKKYTLPNKIDIYAPELANEANYFIREIKDATNLAGAIVSNQNKCNLSLQIDASKVEKKEGYKLTITPKKIEVVGHDASGVFYGLQSLIQLVYDATSTQTKTINAQVVEDAPAFSWRAYMLDEGRYFKGEQEVYRLLDEMAALKLNVFHWHLTEDLGWRIEIKKYPLLTEIGGFRKDTEIETWGSGKLAGKPHSGYYTQEEIIRILKYAKERHIKVVPEIEMPGHASAAIAAYPWLGSSDEKIEVPILHGKHYPTFNVANERVQNFLKDVLDEVIELFKGYTDVIHIGGDEVRFNHWENNAEINALKEKKGFTSYMDVQIDFTNMISRYIDSKDARMMGWNEVLGTNLHTDDNISFSDPSQKVADNIIVHFWKGDPESITQAVKNGYDVVNSYHVYSYIDYSYKSIPLEKSYSFVSVSPNIPEEYRHKVIGIGCQMWGEWTPEVANIHERTFPRIAAYAEVAWTPEEGKDYKSFLLRMKYFTDRWTRKNIGYHQLDELK